MRHLTEDDLTLLHYGELSEEGARNARAHLDACVSCRADQTELERLFALVDSAPVPEPAQGFETAVWQRLQPALRSSRPQRTPSVTKRLRGWFVPAPGWAAGGALVAIVLVAFLLGRYSQQPAAPPPAEVTASVPQQTVRERVLLSALGDHFERSQAVLVELTSATPADSVDISAEQRRAHDLLAATRIYRRAASEAGDRTVRDVLEALERVLVEVDVSPSQLSAYELRSLQNRIEEQELLFKVRVASAGVREREQSTRRPPVRPSAGV